MALINCPECGKEISDMAKSCPGCGRPIINNKTYDSLNNKNSKKVKNKFSVEKLRVIFGIASIVCIFAIVFTTTQNSTVLLYHFIAALLLFFFRNKETGSIVSLPFTILGFLSYNYAIIKYKESLNLITWMLCAGVCCGVFYTCKKNK